MHAAPRTLLNFADVPVSELDISDACLILVDYQKEYLTGSLVLTGASTALDEASATLALFRSAGAPVFHVVHHGRPGGALFDPGGDLVNIPDDLAPLPGEDIVIKSLPNSFAGTKLEEMVRATGRRQVVVIGFMTHMCVESTVRAASELGFNVMVIANACATRDLPDPIGADTRISATDLHLGALAALSDRFATVVPRAPIIESR